MRALRLAASNAGLGSYIIHDTTSIERREIYLIRLVKQHTDVVALLSQEIRVAHLCSRPV